MSLESDLFELQQENERLQSDIANLQKEGDSNTLQADQKDQIREQIEALWQEKLTYKEGEIDSINIKLSRISQSNIEMKSRCDRLESSNDILSGENEQNRTKIQNLEMELEMTKVNSERDTEHLIEQQSALNQEISNLNGEIDTLNKTIETLTAQHNHSSEDLQKKFDTL